MLKNGENNGMEDIGLVTPTPVPNHNKIQGRANYVHTF